MARYFASLKLRMMRNGLRRNPKRLPWVLAAVIIPVPIGIVVFSALARASDARHPETLAVVTLCAILGAWITIPLLGFGSDDTLDPATFALLPLSRRELMRGMAASALVGVAPAMTLAVLCGAVLGYGGSPLTTTLAIVIVSIALAMCVAVSRAVVSAMGELLRSRRGRDIAVVASMAIVVGIQLANSQARSTVDGAKFDTAAHWLQWTPPGMLGQALAALPTRYWHSVAIGLGVGIATVALAVATWNWTLQRSTLRPARRAAARRASRTSDQDRRSSLFPAALPFLPRSRVGAVAARELRGFRRDPRRAAMLVPAIAVPIVWALSTHPAGTSFARAAPLFALAAVVFTNRFSANLFGVDGSAYWPHVIVGSDPTPDIFGKQLAISVIITPIVVVIAAGLGIIANALPVALLTIALLPAVLGLHLGLGAIASARFPQAIPDSGNPFGTLSGQGCASGLAVIALLTLELVLMLPAAVAIIVVARDAPGAIVLVVAAAWLEGFAVWRMGSRHAGRYLRFRLPELLAAVDARQA